MEVAVGGHPIRAVHQDLRIHGHATELALHRLTGTDVERYLSLRFSSADFARELVERIFARTGGILCSCRLSSIISWRKARWSSMNWAGGWSAKTRPRMTACRAIWKE